MTCLVGHPAAVLFGSWSTGSQFVWKWEYLEKFLRDLLFVLDVVIAEFNIEKLSHGHDISDINAAVLKSVQRAIQFPHIKGISLQLRMVAVRLGMEARWCEGCKCHEHILHDNRFSLQSRRRKYQVASAECSNRGRRGVEMAMGRAEAICTGILAAHSDAYSVYLAMHPEARHSLSLRESRIKEKIVDTISMKLDFWSHIPYKFLGCLANHVGVGSLEEARECCRQCLAERDAVIANDNLDYLHRVAQKLSLGEGNQVRRDLEDFATGSEPSLGPHATLELQAYARGQIVTRRVEGAHGIIKKHQKAKDWMLPSLLNTYLKRPELNRALDTPDFWHFAVAMYRKRRLPRLSNMLPTYFSYVRVGK